MRSIQSLFFIPLVLLWGAVAMSTLDPALIQSDIRFDPDIERNDLLQIDLGGEVALDDLVIYRLNWVDFVARVIGLPGDQIMLGIDGRSILRNGERVVVAPRGLEILTNADETLTLAADEAAVYVHDMRRNPISNVISRDAIRGPVEAIYRYRELDRADWMRIGASSLVVLALVVLPYVAFVRQRPQTFLRLVILVTHTFLSMVVAGALLMVSLPGDPLRLGVGEPMWWWFPLSVIAGFRIELLLFVALLLAVEWLSVVWQRRSAA